MLSYYRTSLHTRGATPYLREGNLPHVQRKELLAWHLKSPLRTRKEPLDTSTELAGLGTSPAYRGETATFSGGKKIHWNFPRIQRKNAGVFDTGKTVPEPPLRTGREPSMTCVVPLIHRGFCFNKYASKPPKRQSALYSPQT